MNACSRSSCAPLPAAAARRHLLAPGTIFTLPCLTRRPPPPTVPCPAVGRQQAGHAGDWRCDPGPAVHPAGRADKGQHGASSSLAAGLGACVQQGRRRGAGLEVARVLHRARRQAWCKVSCRPEQPKTRQRSAPHALPPCSCLPSGGHPYRHLPAARQQLSSRLAAPDRCHQPRHQGLAGGRARTLRHCAIARPCRRGCTVSPSCNFDAPLAAALCLPHPPPAPSFPVVWLPPSHALPNTAVISAFQSALGAQAVQRLSGRSPGSQLHLLVRHFSTRLNHSGSLVFRQKDIHTVGQAAGHLRLAASRWASVLTSHRHLQLNDCRHSSAAARGAGLQGNGMAPNKGGW